MRGCLNPVTVFFIVIAAMTLIGQVLLLIGGGVNRIFQNGRLRRSTNDRQQ